MEIKEIVKGNKATISFVRQGNVFYNVTVDSQTFQFPVSLDDLNGASLFKEEKAITLMRYIRKALKEGTFVLA